MKAKVDFLWWKKGDDVDVSEQLPENVEKWISNGWLEQEQEPEKMIVDKPATKKRVSKKK